MYIYAFSNHTEIVEKALSNKKVHLKKRVNRADNFIDLTLLGAEKCLEDLVLDPESNLYMASDNGNMNTTIKVLSAIFEKNQLPMPFNFLNSVNASILFFVAKNFNIEGKTLFVDRFESALPQAFVDVKNGKTVLLGMVEEAIVDLELHKKRFGCDEIEERSRWLLLSLKLEDKKPIGEICDIKLTSSSKENDIDELFSFLEKGDGFFDFQGRNLSFRLKK